MRLIFIRHGETDWNATLRYQGQNATPLNERGREQARRAAERLGPYRAAALYSSDIVRAWQTAAIIGAQLGLTAVGLPGLREIDVGDWEGLTPEELHQRYPEHMAEFERDPANTVRLGGESYAQLQVRAMQAVETMLAAAADQTVIAVAHGGTIRAVICQVIGLDLANFGRLWLDNGSLTELRLGSKGWRLLRMNDTAHLEGSWLAQGE